MPPPRKPYRADPGFPAPEALRCWLGARTGDPRSSAVLIRAVAPFLVTICSRRRNTDPAALGDLVHETLLEIYRQRDSLDPDCPLSLWLLELTRHAMDEYFQPSPTGRRPEADREAIPAIFSRVEAID